MEYRRSRLRLEAFESDHASGLRRGLKRITPHTGHTVCACGYGDKVLHRVQPNRATESQLKNISCGSECAGPLKSALMYPSQHQQIPPLPNVRYLFLGFINSRWGSPHTIRQCGIYQASQRSYETWGQILIWYR